MAKTVKIFCMGDSLTEGDGNASAYRYQLFERLWKSGVSFRFLGSRFTRDDLRLPKIFACHGGNCGFKIGGGEKTGGCLTVTNLENPEYVQALSGADIVLLCIGANDIAQNDDLEHIIDRYENLLDMIWAFAPEASIYGSSIIFDSEPYEKFKTDLAAFAPKVCEKTGKRFIYVDLGKFTPDDLQEGDGHPNESGNSKMAQAFFDAIIDEVRSISEMRADCIEEPYYKANKLKVYTKDAKLKVGQTLTIKTDVLPDNATVKTLLFKSSNSDVAEVDMFGAIHARSEGEAIITATALDGGMSEDIKITVCGKQDLIGGMTQIYKSDMLNPDNFEGNIANINNKFNKFRVPYRGYLHTLRAKNFSYDGEKVLFKFKFFTSNHCGRDKNSYSSVMLGELELRIGGLATYVMLYQGGKLLGAYSHLPRGSFNDEYTVSVESKSAKVYRDGELLLDTELDNRRITGGIAIYWRELGCKTEIRDVEVYI